IDLFGRDVHEPQNVALRTLRDGQDPRRPFRRHGDRSPRVGEREAVGQVLRKHQVNAVVDGHNGSTRHERRQYVMWRVKQSDLFTPERQGQLDLLGDRVVAGRFDHGPEVFAQRIERLAIVATAEENEFRVVIDAGKMAQQIPDVGADAEVVQLAGVYADSHALDLTQEGRDLGGHPNPAINGQLKTGHSR